MLFGAKAFADNHNVFEILELIQKDIKTLEKAVYSDSNSENSNNSNIQSSLDQNNEDVLTRHLLKLSEIESQFQELTNKFEEINFKLDKLSSRLSKVQADNQVRFQQLENITVVPIDENSKITSLPKGEINIMFRISGPLVLNDFLLNTIFRFNLIKGERRTKILMDWKRHISFPKYN